MCRSPLLSAVFAAIASPQLIDVAADCIVELVFTYFSMRRDSEVIAVLVPRVLALVPGYDAAVAADDEDTAKTLCRVFVDTGECYMSLMLEADEGVQYVRLVWCAALVCGDRG